MNIRPSIDDESPSTRTDTTPPNLDTDSMTARASATRSGLTHPSHARSDRTGSADERFGRVGRGAPVGAIASVLVLLLLLVLDSAGLAAQQGPGASLGSQSLRPYAHVFWAYGLAWALVLGWVVSISRRWSRVEDDLERQSGSE